MNHTLLLVPVTGILQMFSSDHDLDQGPVLRKSGGRGPLLSITLEVDNRPVGKIWMCADDTQMVNFRARSALYHLNQVHMLFQGPVLFTDLDEDTAYGIIEELSAKGGE